MARSGLIVAITLLVGSPAVAQTPDDTAASLRALLDDRDRLAKVAASSADVDALKAQIADRDAQIQALQAQVTRLTPPSEPDLSVAVSVGDVIVGPGQRVAQVPVTLSAPTDHTLVVTWNTANGAGTYPPTFYTASAGTVVFQPGEKTKIVTVPLARDLTAAQAITVAITGFPTNPPAAKGRISGSIRGGGATPAAAMTPDMATLPARPANKSLVWSQDFADPAFCVSDTGLDAAGKPCWQGRPTHGLTQDGNKETGLYASPDRFPSVTMTGLGPDGKRFIQLERHPEGFSEGGKPLVHSWDSKPFVYSSAMFQASKFPAMISAGSYVEARLKMDLVQGTWPAFWLLPADGSWPPEIDVLEGFWGKAPLAPDALTMTMHWRDAAGAARTYGTGLPLHQIISGFDVRQWHTYSVFIEANWLTYYVDDVPVWRAPNATRRGTKWYPLFDVTTGGLVGEPAADAPLPAKMGLDWLRVWN